MEQDQNRNAYKCSPLCEQIKHMRSRPMELIKPCPSLIRYEIKYMHATGYLFIKPNIHAQSQHSFDTSSEVGRVGQRKTRPQRCRLKQHVRQVFRRLIVLCVVDTPLQFFDERMAWIHLQCLLLIGVIPLPHQWPLYCLSLTAHSLFLLSALPFQAGPGPLTAIHHWHVWTSGMSRSLAQLWYGDHLVAVKVAQTSDQYVTSCAYASVIT